MRKSLIVLAGLALFLFSCKTEPEPLVPSQLLGHWSWGELSSNPYSVYEHYTINDDNLVHRRYAGGVSTVDQALQIESVENKGNGIYWFFFSNYGYRIEVTILDSNSIEILGDTYYQKQPEKKYPVRFNSNGGTTVSSIQVAFGGKIPEPEKPQKGDYPFRGWYKDAELTIPWNFQQDVVNSSITTLYACWGYEHEVRNIYNSKNKYGEMTVYWVNPVDEDFSYVKITLYAENYSEYKIVSKGANSAFIYTQLLPPDQWWVDVENILLQCIDKNGHISSGVIFNIRDETTLVWQKRYF